MALATDIAMRQRQHFILNAKLRACAAAGRVPSIDLIAECFAWGVGERDQPEKKKPARGGPTSRTGKR